MLSIYDNFQKLSLDERMPESRKRRREEPEQSWDKENKPPAYREPEPTYTTEERIKCKIPDAPRKNKLR
jgi:hypothetical protein